MYCASLFYQISIANRTMFGSNGILLQAYVYDFSTHSKEKYYPRCKCIMIKLVILSYQCEGSSEPRNQPAIWLLIRALFVIQYMDKCCSLL
jgi:hypothetical protein